MGFVSQTLAIGAGIIIAIPVIGGLDPKPEQPKPADIPAAQRTLDRAEAFLSRHTGAPEERRTLEVGLPQEVKDRGGIAGTLGDVIVADESYVIAWARMDQAPGLDGWDLEAARVALHEEGHAEDDVPGDATDEGLRDAVALDLVPAFTYAQTGQKAAGYGGASDAAHAYQEWVTRVRALSARATCARPRSYAARSWVARISVRPRSERMAAFTAAAANVCGAPR